MLNVGDSVYTRAKYGGSYNRHVVSRVTPKYAFLGDNEYEKVDREPSADGGYKIHQADSFGPYEAYPINDEIKAYFREAHLLRKLESLHNLMIKSVKTSPDELEEIYDFAIKTLGK